VLRILERVCGAKGILQGDREELRKGGGYGSIKSRVGGRGKEPDRGRRGGLGEHLEVAMW